MTIVLLAGALVAGLSVVGQQDSGRRLKAGAPAGRPVPTEAQRKQVVPASDQVHDEDRPVTAKIVERATPTAPELNHRLNVAHYRADPHLVDRLQAMVEDERLPAAHRNYAVQHIALHWELTGDRRAIRSLVEALSAEEVLVAEDAMFNLARLKAQGAFADGSYASMALDEAITRAIEGRSPLIESAVCSVAVLGRGDWNPVLLDLAADVDAAASLRVSAFDALAQVGCERDPALEIARAVLRADGTPKVLRSSARRLHTELVGQD